MPSLLLIICIVGCIITGVYLVYFIKVAKVRQDLAFKGDPDAAKRIVLPCYRPLFRGLVLFYFSVAVSLCFTFTISTAKSQGQRRIIQYFCFSLLTVYAIAPVLLLQNSVSMSAFWKTFFTIF